MTKLEEIAQAIKDSLDSRNTEEPSGGDYILAAGAAVEAMREPSEAMKNCSEEIHWGYSCHVCGGLSEGWYAMMDAVLAEKP